MIIKFIKAWWKAFRPFSLVIAGVSCLLGITLAFKDGHLNYLNAVLTMAGGLLIHSGVNLINDFFEFKQRIIDDKIPKLKIFGQKRELIEWIIFVSGLGCFGLVVPIGLYLVYLTGWPLLVLGIVGFIGGYFYTGEPFNYKRRGLGVPFVFFLMGVFMIAGSYYAVSAAFNWSILWVSIPVSLLVSNILLANELRDHEADTRHGIPTLTVRIGYQKSYALLIILFGLAYLTTVLLAFLGLFTRWYLILLALPLAMIPIMILRPEGLKKRTIIPWMMLHHLIFGIIFVGNYILDIIAVWPK